MKIFFMLLLIVSALLLISLVVADPDEVSFPRREFQEDTDPCRCEVAYLPDKLKKNRPSERISYKTNVFLSTTIFSLAGNVEHII
jgi:hypothetical protein